MIGATFVPSYAVAKLLVLLYWKGQSTWVACVSTTWSFAATVTLAVLVLNHRLTVALCCQRANVLGSNLISCCGVGLAWEWGCSLAAAMCMHQGHILARTGGRGMGTTSNPGCVTFWTVQMRRGSKSNNPVSYTTQMMTGSELTYGAQSTHSHTVQLLNCEHSQQSPLGWFADLTCAQ